MNQEHEDPINTYVCVSDEARALGVSRTTFRRRVMVAEATGMSRRDAIRAVCAKRPAP